MTLREELLEAAERQGVDEDRRRKLALLTDLRQTHLTDPWRGSQ